mmetsp:Transcript_15205/g.28370  ORF Transcript_15205/g.28370 Transcript_15205/m.28370 type:complete len:228 (+) Transcript_15205:1105-1788(+)
MHITRIMIIMGATNPRPCSRRGKLDTNSARGSQYSFSFAAVNDKLMIVVGILKDKMISAETPMLRRCFMKRLRIVRSRFDHIRSDRWHALLVSIWRGAGYSFVCAAMFAAVMLVKVTKPVLLIGFPMTASMVLSTTDLARYLSLSSLRSSFDMPLMVWLMTSRGTFCHRAPEGSLKQQQQSRPFSLSTSPRIDLWISSISVLVSDSSTVTVEVRSSTSDWSLPLREE